MWPILAGHDIYNFLNLFYRKSLQTAYSAY